MLVKRKIFLSFVLLLSGNFYMTPISSAEAPTSFYDFKLTDINGAPVDLQTYKGKVALVVNTASRCGFTSQYKGLEELYEKYRAQGLVVFGFPSNDYMKQEPGDNEEIKKFCELKYGVTFPLFAKAPVSGENKQEVYRFLTEQSSKDFQGDPGWNFVKFLVSKKGEVIGRYSSMTKPDNGDLVGAIEKALAEN